MTAEELSLKFSDHTATASQIAQIGVVKAYAHALGAVILDFVPAGPDQTAAIRKVHEAFMTASFAILTEPEEGKLDDIAANAFTDFFKSFGGFFKGMFTKDAQAKIEIGITSFITTDLGALAVDAVEYVEGALAGSTGTEKRDAAVTKLKTDAAAAGKDLSAFAGSTLNWFVETALQAVVAKGLTAAAQLAVHV